MKQWEYKIVEQWEDIRINLKKHLTILGKEGWELTCHDFGCFIFKRELNTQNASASRYTIEESCKGMEIGEF